MTVRALIIGIVASAFAFLASAAPEVDLTEPEFPLMSQQAWAMVIDQDAETITHDLTGFVCPFYLPSGYAIQSSAQYKLGGEDVSCAYVREGRRAYISYYLSWYGNPAGSKEQAESVISTLNTIKILEDEVANKPVSLALGETDLDCHYIEHVELISGEKAKTAVRTCSIGPWVYKTRFTWYEGEEFAEADLAFQTQQATAGHTFSTCAAIALPKDTAIAGDTSNVIALSLMATLASDDLNFIVGDGDDEAAKDFEASIRQRADEGDYQCVLDVPSSDTDAYTLRVPAASPIHKASYTKSDIYGRESKPLLWVSGLSLGALVLEDTTYAAWVSDKDETEHLIETYKTLPTTGQMQDLLNKLLSGNVTSLASYKRDTEGNSTLSLNADTLDEADNE